MSTSIQTNKIGPATEGNRTSLVSCAVEDPLFGVHPAVMSLLSKLIEVRLGSEGIIVKTSGGIYRSAYLALGFEIPNDHRRKALRIICALVTERGLLPGIPSVAFWCEAELCWRNVIGNAQFDRFFSETEMADAKREADERRQQIIDRLNQALTCAKALRSDVEPAKSDQLGGPKP